MGKDFNIHEWNKSKAIREMAEGDSLSDDVYDKLLTWFESQKNEGERFRYAYEIFKEYSNAIKTQIIQSQLFEDKPKEH